MRRTTSSVAHHAEGILSGYGVKKITARIVTCAPRPRVQTWKKLERATLLAFRAQYGKVPVYNFQGQKIRETDEYEYFRREAVRKLIIELG